MIYLKSFIFKLRPTELLILCLFIIPNQWLLELTKCSCRCLALSSSKKNFWSFMFLSLALTFPNLTLTFPSITFLASHFLSLALSYSNLIFSSLILLAFYIHLTLFLLHQILISGTFVLSQSCQCNAFQSKIVGGLTKTMVVIWSWTARL